MTLKHMPSEPDLSHARTIQGVEINPSIDPALFKPPPAGGH